MRRLYSISALITGGAMRRRTVWWKTSQSARSWLLYQRLIDRSSVRSRRRRKDEQLTNDMDSSLSAVAVSLRSFRCAHSIVSAIYSAFT